MDTKIGELLECLIDEIKASGDSSERTIMVLAQYEDEYDIVKKYFKETDNE
jgi:hypothetical protein